MTHIGKPIRELTVHPLEWPQVLPQQEAEPVALPEPERVEEPDPAER
jgi:hypothetical protein